MPITEALKKLIKTITGKNAVGETIEELVQNLNDNYPEGGETSTVDSELSDTSENPVQNKVITAALAAKGDDFPVILTETGGVISCENATISEIETAARAIKNVFAILDDGTGILRMPLVYAMDGLVQFGCTNLDYDGSTWSTVPSGILGKVEAGADTWTPVGG